MKFIDIKPGDIVYVKSAVRVGWSNVARFWLPKSVDKVTPKQFVIGDNRYKKEDGKCIGGSYDGNAANLGDSLYRDEVVVDQTASRNSLVRSLNIVSEITSIIDQFKIDHKHPKLKEVHAKLKEAEALLVEA